MSSYIKTYVNSNTSRKAKTTGDNELSATLPYSDIISNENLFLFFLKLIVTEFSSAIKGQGLQNDRKKYIHSEKKLSRLHGKLSVADRQMIFDCFLMYQSKLDELECIDSDDIALSMLGQFRMPLWNVKKKTLGFDYIFVDEIQLFNDNERRLFALLLRGQKKHLPIAFALDDAQDVYGQATSGLGALGFDDITDEALPSSHRSTQEIVDLCFFVLQRTTDLFGPDFPDIRPQSVTTLGKAIETLKPKVEVASHDSPTFAKFIVRRFRELRRSNLRQVAVICHAPTLWRQLETEIRNVETQEKGLKVYIFQQRGDNVDKKSPCIVLSKPEHIGGQEFDAVIAVGLEQGLIPPKIHDNDTLASAIEQQVLREMYVSFSRARFQLIIALQNGAIPNAIIQQALEENLVEGPARQ